MKVVYGDVFFKVLDTFEDFIRVREDLKITGDEHGNENS